MVFPLERIKEKGYEQMEEACHEGDDYAAEFVLGWVPALPRGPVSAVARVEGN